MTSDGQKQGAHAQRQDVHDWDEVEEATELLLEGAHEAVLEELRRVLQQSPNNPYAYYYLAVAFYALKRPEAARDAYQATLRLSPDYLAARVALAHVLRELGDLEEAMLHAKTALQRFPDDGDAMHARALIHAARGELSRAKRYFQDYLKTSPALEAQLEVRSMIEMIDQATPGQRLTFDAGT